MTRVALLTAGFGDGHHQVAEALRQAFEQFGTEVAVFDFYRSENAAAGKFNEHIYEWTTRYVPLLYGASYRVTAGLGPSHWLWRLLSLSSASRFLKRLDAYQPDAVLQLFPDHSLRHWPLARFKRPFVGTIITDFSVHGRWFHHHVDAYYIPHAGLLEAVNPFVEEGADVVVSGIPLRQQFVTRESSPDEAMKRPYILIATGGRGLFPALEPTLKTLRDTWHNSHLYVLCGRNTRMQDAVSRLAESDEFIHALPFVENVAVWYSNAQFAIVKSGGLTVSECLASGCPMVIYKPQSGQEADNAAFVRGLGAAEIVTGMATLRDALVRLQSPPVLSGMRNACLEAGRTEAADVVARHILQQFEK